MNLFYHNLNFKLALLSLALIFLGDLIRKGDLTARNLLKVFGGGFLIVAGFLAIVKIGDLTDGTGPGAFHQLSPLFDFVFNLNSYLAPWLKINSQPLITGGMVFLFLTAVLALIFKRKAGAGFFWAAFSLAMAIKGQAFLVIGQRTPGTRFYLIAAAGAILFGLFKDRPAPERVKSNVLLKKIGVTILIVGAIITGFYDLGEHPKFDAFESTNAIVSLQVNEGDPDTFKLIWGFHPRSYPGDSSSSPFIVLSTALLFRIAGATPFTFRAMAVFWGLGGLIFLYLLINELFGFRIAWTAIFLSLVSPWFLAIIKVGTFGSISLFFAFLIFYLLLRAIRTSRVIFYILMGAVLSFYCFFYLPTKTLFPFVVVILLYKSLFFRKFFRKNWLGITTFLVTFIVFLSFHTSPLSLIFDTAYTSSKGGSHFPFIGSETRADMEIRWDIVPQQVQKNFYRIFSCLYIQRGGGSFIHPPNGPLLNRTIFMLAILGLAFTIPRFRREEYFFLLVWLGPALMPDLILTPRIGSFPRHGLLCIPLIYVLASIFVVKTGEAFGGLLSGRWSIITSSFSRLAVTVLLIVLAIVNLTNFFNQTPVDYTGFGLNIKDLLSRGYKLIIHLSDGTLHPARRLDFIAYPEVKKLYYYHNHRQYYQYQPVGKNPRYRYEAGMARLGNSVNNLAEAGIKTGVVVVPAYGDALKKQVEKLLPGATVEEIRSRYKEEDRILGYQCLVDPERGKIN